MDGQGTVRIPKAGALVASPVRAVWFTSDGGAEGLALAEAARRAHAAAPIVVHAPATARRLQTRRFRALDLLELFAFVRPARFCLPTANGLADVLGLPRPATLERAGETLLAAARFLLAELGGIGNRRDVLADLALAAARGGWPWGPSVLAALGAQHHDAPPGSGFRVWDRLPQWVDLAPPPPGASHAVEPEAARQRLAEMLGPEAEDRPGQGDYASAVASAFAPREERGKPNMVIAEAGTGVGKTLGYLAPASLWAERNLAPVWVATYTRNLQHQIDGELDRLIPEPAEKRRRVVLRKGRENYLCLLNLQEAVERSGGLAGEQLPFALMVRWAEATRDGDMTGGDFPSWLADLLGPGPTRGLADRRGECIRTACPHHQRCFIEHGVRKARRADLVVSNHALVLTQAVLGDAEGGELPVRYVFDEGHHLFDAADGAFAAALSGGETGELRRWLLGAEGASSRARGLSARCEDLLGGSAEAAEALREVLGAAAALPGGDWLARLAEDAPAGVTETFLAIVRRQVLARTGHSRNAYGIECDVWPLADGLAEASRELADALRRLRAPVGRLRRHLLTRLEDEAKELETRLSVRIEGLAKSLHSWAETQLDAWIAMLAALEEGASPEFVDWFALERIGGREVDVGMRRHWVDPMAQFAKAVAEPAHGLVVTSATIRDGTPDPEANWRAAEIRTGARHLEAPAVRATVPSPFDYARQTRILVVGDVDRDATGRVAAAFRELFLASGGGALGLFTAIARLRAVHRELAPALDAAGIELLAQHVDQLDVATLIEIFRAETDSCLLGTDAVRDGVDVPGRALRLIVFDRVPWPRPSILHRARRKHFGGGAHDDMLTRLRLSQAFGRLIRRQDDRGVFVLLDPRMPGKFRGAFPAGPEVERVGLAAACNIVSGFLKDDPA